MTSIEIAGAALVAGALLWFVSVVAIVVVGLGHVRDMESPDGSGCGRRGCRREACRQGREIVTRAAEPLRVFPDTNWRE